MKRLRENEIETFRREGIAFPVSVFDRDEVAERYGLLCALESERAGRLPPLLNFKPYLLVPWIWDLIHDGRILDPVEELLGPDLLCWEASFFSKGPQDAAHVTWHQDATYWGLSENQGVTAWLAFTPSTTDNGCMRVVPGSHHRQLRHAGTHDRDNMLPAGEQVCMSIDDRDAVDVVLAQGEMSLHHPLLVHGSKPNRSAAPRVGFAIRYVSAHVHQRGGRRGTATLVRGRDHGYFDLEVPPEAEFGAAARARHGPLLRRFHEIVSAEAAMHS